MGKRKNPRKRREGESADEYLERMVALEAASSRRRKYRAKDKVQFESSLGRRKRRSEEKLTPEQLRILEYRRRQNAEDTYRIRQLEMLAELSDEDDCDICVTIEGLKAEIAKRNAASLSPKLPKLQNEEEGFDGRTPTTRGLEGVGEGFLTPLLAPPPLGNPPRAKMTPNAAESFWNPFPLPSKNPNKNPSDKKRRAQTRARERHDVTSPDIKLLRQPGEGKLLLAIEQWVYEQESHQRPEQPWPVKLALTVLVVAVMVRECRTRGCDLRLPARLLELSPGTDLPEMLEEAYQRGSRWKGCDELGLDPSPMVASVEQTFCRCVPQWEEVTFPVALRSARAVLLGEVALKNPANIRSALWRNRVSVCQKLQTDVLPAYLRGRLVLVGGNDER